MAARNRVSYEELTSYLRYDPDTGLWWWVKTNQGSRRQDKPAGFLIATGERYLRIGGSRGHPSKYLAVLFMTGEWPERGVRHKNGIKNDDRWDNLVVVEEKMWENVRRYHKDINEAVTEHKAKTGFKEAPFDHGYLRRILDYDSETGKWYKPDGTSTGFLAGGREGRRYWYVTVDGKGYQSSRLAYFYMTGRWPEHQIDHIDGDSTNDSWSNLRDATNRQNNYNKQPISTNKSGVPGVFFNRKAKKWEAGITMNYKYIYLGIFDKFKYAVEARKEAERIVAKEFAPKK